MCVPGQTIDPSGTDGDDFALAVFDKMISNLKVRANPAFICNSTIIEKYYAQLRSLGGADPRTIAIPGFGNVITYRGIPILQNDNIPSDETVGSTTDATSLYLAALDEDEGLALAAGGRGDPLTPDADPRTRPVLGFRVERVGSLESKDARRTRVKWYGAPMLKSTLALVRKQGVKTAA